MHRILFGDVLKDLCEKVWTKSHVIARGETHLVEFDRFKVSLSIVSLCIGAMNVVLYVVQINPTVGREDDYKGGRF